LLHNPSLCKEPKPTIEDTIIKEEHPPSVNKAQMESNKSGQGQRTYEKPSTKQHISNTHYPAVSVDLIQQKVIEGGGSRFSDPP
ncbi:hypothetical protein PIB30_115707, partial [Stylosanthes scabra]|nr:hypothetical protein [Stylosanthes scabra]